MKTKFKLLITYVIFFLIMIGASGFIMMSPMLFDSPGSEDLIILWIIVYALWSFAPVFIASVIGSLILYRKKKEKASIIFSLLPLINIVIVVLGIIIHFG